MEFIFTIILMISLAVIVYMMAAALPRIEEKEEIVKIKLLERLARSEIPEKIDIKLNKFLEKFLRKAKVLMLRLDNNINILLNRIKTKEEKESKSLEHLTKDTQNSENNIEAK
jgi:hypothetical protein